MSRTQKRARRQKPPSWEQGEARRGDRRAVGHCHARFRAGEPTPEEFFAPEDPNPNDERQIAATAAKLAREEILPGADAVEAKKERRAARAGSRSRTVRASCILNCTTLSDWKADAQAIRIG